MKFNYGFEKKRFDEKWARTEKEYRAAGMAEDAIRAMYEYDWEMFKSERTYCRHTQMFDCIWGEDNYSGTAGADDYCDEQRTPYLERFFERFSVRPHDVDPDRDDAWIDGIDNKDLLQGVLKLSPEDQLLLKLRVLDEYSFSEIGEIFGEKEDTVSRRFRRICRKLRDGK